jgi:hypothetical protein
MVKNRVKIGIIIENQIPRFVKEDFPLVLEFLSQYYHSLESPSLPYDILNNIDQYVKVDAINRQIEKTSLIKSITFYDKIIEVESTDGFPENYGLLRIQNPLSTTTSEIITYRYKDDTKFYDCSRGFSGIVSYEKENVQDELEFSSSEANDFPTSSIVYNLNYILLSKFFSKLKYQFTPGFDEVELYSGLNQATFLKQSSNFYGAKGTDSSFKVLFNALYSKPVEVIKPRDYLIQPSDADYRITRDLVVEKIEGNPENLVNRTLYFNTVDDNNFGTVNKVEKIKRGNKDYYVISLDINEDIKQINEKNTEKKSFSEKYFPKIRVHAKTKIIGNIDSSTNTIDVDSTIGFPPSGNLVFRLEDTNETIKVFYSKKSTTQFYNCSGITRTIFSGTEVNIDDYAIAYTNSERTEFISVRISGILSGVNVVKSDFSFSPNDTIEINSLGTVDSDIRSNSWILNIASSYNISSIQVQDIQNFLYKIILYDDSIILPGDELILTSQSQTKYEVTVTSQEDLKTYFIRATSIINILEKISLERKISKVIASNYPNLNTYNANVQNIYSDEENSVYITSHSIPNYFNESLSVKENSIIFSGNYPLSSNDTLLKIGKHPFYTGDSVIYNEIDESNRLNLKNGIYFVNVVDQETIQLARSLPNIFSNNYLKISGNIINNSLKYTNFYDVDIQRSELTSLDAQNLIRVIKDPIDDGKNYETQYGTIGLLLNGVEILNYKSEDNIFYGEIEEIIVTSPGSGYDIINPPELVINDIVDGKTYGRNCIGYCEIVGGLNRIEIIDGGFDYEGDPKIEIKGGNGKGAIAIPNLISYDYSIDFNSEFNSQLVNLSNNTISFLDYHKLKNGERVYYFSYGQKEVNGLKDGSTYFVEKIDEYSIKLYKTLEDCLNKLNAIDIDDYGTGNHRIQSFEKKKKIDSIKIESPGSGYTNKKIRFNTTINPDIVNIYNDTFIIKNHGFFDGDLIKYKNFGTSIGGITSENNYYIKKIDSDTFKLCSVQNIAGFDEKFFFNNRIYVNITSIGSGYQEFNYPDISVKVISNSGISTVGSQSDYIYQPILQPIFTGEIKSVFLENGGIGYGTSTIINYNRSPQISINVGSGARLTAVLSSEGSIVQVLVDNGGSGYSSPPKINVIGDGFDAELVAVIDFGSITSVQIVKPGIGYSNLDLEVISNGSGASFEAKIQSWNINTVERNFIKEQITDDDSFVFRGLNSNYGYQYTHAYAPRKLRRLLLSKKLVDGNNKYQPDLIYQNKELRSSSHSPIIGWAYDGNPIYGPYSYSNTDGTGQIREMTSSYVLVEKSNRPNISNYPLGLFVEDYEFNGSGDLDKFNGRFCITPEFPQGIYAYFSTIDPNNTSPIFSNYKKPVFPYFIGNEFKSKPIEFNFDLNSTQDISEVTEFNYFIFENLIDSNAPIFDIRDLHRNTKKYNINYENSKYDYIIDPNSIKRQNTLIQDVGSGYIEKFNVLSGGSGYKVDDIVLLDDLSDDKNVPYGNISEIEGKSVISISCTQKTYENVEFQNYFTENSVIGIASTFHNLNNFDQISISFEGKKEPIQAEVRILENKLSLNQNILNSSTTGIITYVGVYGNINYPNIIENDFYSIGSERIKVLEVDTNLSRIKIQRQIDGTIGSSHSIGDVLTELSRKFIFNYNSDNKSYKINREIYFNPSESVSIGTGIGSTLTINNPGIGNSEIFAISRSIYLPNHPFTEGEELTYNSNYGSPLIISDNTIPLTYTLQDNSKVYVSNLSKNFIGISTLRTSIGSTFNNVYFIGIGTGQSHSFKTNYNNLLKGRIDRNEVIVSTLENHELQNNDIISISCIPKSTKIINVKYNDANRRSIFNYKSFSSSDVNIQKNTIKILNHNFYNGQKVIYDAVNPISGLVINKIYYVIVVDSDTIKLTELYYETEYENIVEVNLNSAQDGFIYPINPPINFIQDQSLQFDLSDPTLSFSSNNTIISAFVLNFYTDEAYKDKFIFIDSLGKNKLSSVGRVGIDTISYIKIDYFDQIPEKLYYRLDPILSNNLPTSKKEIIIDSDIKNTITKKLSDYSGSYKISGITTQTLSSFKYVLPAYPEESSYVKNINAEINYYSNSKNISGPIKTIELKNNFKTYKSLPRTSTIITESGSDAILSLSSSSIGNVEKLVTDDIGFDYPSDSTLRPIGSPPIILEIELLSKLKSIIVVNPGKNYTLPPKIILKDDVSNEIIKDIDLNYSLNPPNVNILKNSKGFRSRVPKAIPIRNTNGFKIQSIVYNDFTKEAEITLNVVGFSTLSAFPFTVGSRILIEDVSISGEGYGYNSENYNYHLFTVISNLPQIGGQNPKVTVSFNNLIPSGESPGIFDDVIGSGIIVPESYFPTFDISILKNQYIVGENIKESQTTRVIQSWSLDSDYLKVSSYDYEFSVGEIIEGSTSKARCYILKIYDSKAIYDVNASSIKKKGWMKKTGFLNDSYQRIHDSDYYQYFSYSLKTTVQLDDWEDRVNSLNHTSGFKNFCDLSVESIDASSGIGTTQDQGNFTSIANIFSSIDLECVHDFDLASENYYYVDDNLVSNQIYLNSRTIQDYFESIGNRVLVIDDITDQFNSNPRSAEFSIVDSFRVDVVRARKYILYIKDSRFVDERQLLIVSLVHDNNYGYLNQYGRVETTRNLGYFDFTIVDDEGYLVFYPIYFQRNDYTISGVSYNIKDDIIGIGTTSFGDIVFIDTDQVIIPQFTSSPTIISGIGSTYRSAKILIELSASDQSYFEYNELTIIHNGTEIEISEYGKLNTDSLLIDVSEGLGTYYPYYSGSNIVVSFIPNQPLDVQYSANIVNIALASTSTGIGTFNFNTAILDSNYLSIASTSTPVGNRISKTLRDFKGSYYIVSIEDKTNNRYQVSELNLIADDEEAFLTEFGIVSTNGIIGIFTAWVSPTTLEHELYFTPDPNINVEVRVFQNGLKVVDLANTSSIINLNNASVTSMNGSYFGTENDIKRSFEITHKGNNIFEKQFDSEDTDIVDIVNNQIILPNHYFVSGENIEYKVPQSSVLNPSGRIGIATTSIPGIGVTDLLPESVYVIKINDSSIRLSSTAENALSFNPIPLELRSIGIGSVHSFISKKQNGKVLISVDNMIQTPVVSTGVTTNLLGNALPDDTIIYFTGITSFFTNDIIQIDDEIMLIENIGIQSSNGILVRRPWLGTVATGHTVGSMVYKLEGSFNIVDNVLNFVQAPYGKVPLTVPTNIIGPPITRPDDRDYVGITSSSSFSGRVFMRSGIEGGNEESYEKNYIFDDISEKFTGIATQFELTVNGNNINGISTSNALIVIKGIFQDPSRFGPGIITGSYSLQENSGETNIIFTSRTTQNNLDPNVYLLPIGGSILSVGSTFGGGYQPLISAGGTCLVSIAGTIQSISIGNSGSGYRSGIQTTVNVSVATSSTGIRQIEVVGVASILDGRVVGVSITNPGTGYTSTNAPEVIFDAPLNYYNLPLKYSSQSYQGFGTNAYINIVMGQEGKVIDFEIINNGYSYGNGEILTVDVGGSVGIPTDPSATFQEFQIYIDKVYRDTFTGWTIGDIQILDKIDLLFNGVRKVFPIKYQGQQVSLRAKKGSNIDIQATLIVFINNVLQVPGEGYIFKGGSTIRFAEPLPEGTTCTIMFYRGTGGIDVVEVDILETIEIGDYLQLNDSSLELTENSRIVEEIISTDSVVTNVYYGPGNLDDETIIRPVEWCKQRNDIVINGDSITKDRIIYEPLINPVSNIIQNISTSSTIIHVDSVKLFFDSIKENASNSSKYTIEIISQDTIYPAIATAVVSTSGTISAINIVNSGYGYTFNPLVSISGTFGYNNTQNAVAISSISSGIVTSLIIVNPGSGYISSIPPQVLIENPNFEYEKIKNVTYEGDFGNIVGVSVTTVGIGLTAFEFEVIIPLDSILRSTSLNQGITTTGISGIQTDYYFVVKNSNIGSGVTSLRNDGTIIGFTTNYIDNIFQVYSVTTKSKTVYGIGSTTVTSIKTRIFKYDEDLLETFDSISITFDNNEISFDSYNDINNYYGDFTWGRIILDPVRSRSKSRNFSAYEENGYSGIFTSPIIRRVNPLKYLNYLL